jgi:pimeloyl-ACP methyl ester carboxylesterase
MTVTPTKVSPAKVSPASPPSRRAVLGGAAILAALAGPQAQARTPPARNVVLVHGAWADGSCWSAVTSRLLAAGFNVTAVQNPLTSLADDVAATRRALALQDGPTVLVGHSWGGTVITEAGLDPKVTALVYVAARAPDAGEDFNALAARYPTMPARAGVLKADGYSRLSRDAFLKHFAGDVDPVQALALHAAQQPIADDLFSARTTVAAWRSKPSFYAVSSRDETTSPGLERFLAARMNARTIELASSHLSMISHPKAIADLIATAAGAARAAG